MSVSVLQQCLGRQCGQQADVSHTLQGILELAGVVRGDRPAQGWKDLVPGSLETVRADSITVSSHHKTVRGTVGAVRCGPGQLILPCGTMSAVCSCRSFISAGCLVGKRASATHEGRGQCKGGERDV